MTMRAEEALAEVGKVNDLLKMLDEKLQQAMSDPGSEAIPQLQQEISEAMARKRWLLEQIEPMQKAGALDSPQRQRKAPPKKRRG
jgi:predicted translin family RNA/ssDNA-binding protein